LDKLALSGVCNYIAKSLNEFIYKEKLENGLFFRIANRANRDKFTITPPTNVRKDAINEWQTIEGLRLQCNDFIGDDQHLEVFYDDPETTERPRLCGRLRILSNADCRHQIKKVVMVSVNINIRREGGEARRGRLESDDLAILDNVLKQGYVFIPKNDQGRHHIETLDFETKELEKEKEEFIDRFVITNWLGQATIRNGNRDFNELVVFLNKKLSKQNNVYDDYIKIYSINGTSSGIGGVALWWRNACIVFAGHTAETIAHELLHVLRLPHTFIAEEIDEFALKTYEAKQTNNVMDYSHLRTPPINKISLYYWQWKIINPNIS
jgi:hypothetical protein